MLLALECQLREGRRFVLCPIASQVPSGRAYPVPSTQYILTEGIPKFTDGETEAPSADLPKVPELGKGRARI